MKKRNLHLVAGCLLVLGAFHARADSPPLANKYPHDVGMANDSAVVFTEDFEAGNLKKWDDYDGNPEPGNHLMAEPGPFGLKDNHVVRLRVSSKQRGNIDLVKFLPKGYDRLYARWYVQFEPGFNFDAKNHGSGFHAGSRDHLGQSGDRPVGDDWFSSWIEYTTDTHRFAAYTYYRGMYQDCEDPHGKCWGDQFPAMHGGVYAGKPQHLVRTLPPVVEAGKWYCIEMLMDGGTPTDTGAGANGVLDYWIDGVEIGPWNDLWLRTTSGLKIDVLWLNLFHHDGTHSDEGIMIDNVVIATQRIGDSR